MIVGPLKSVARKLGIRNPLAAHTPSNWRVPHATPAEHQAWQVDYAITNGAHCRDRLREFGVDLAGARILEIGPGTVFGPSLAARRRRRGHGHRPLARALER